MRASQLPANMMEAFQERCCIICAGNVQQMSAIFFGNYSRCQQNGMHNFLYLEEFFTITKLVFSLVVSSHQPVAANEDHTDNEIKLSTSKTSNGNDYATARRVFVCDCR